MTIPNVAEDNGSVDLAEVTESLLREAAEELARVLEGLAAAPERLSALGEAGRRFVEQFEQERVLGRFAAQLAELAATAGGRRG